MTSAPIISLIAKESTHQILKDHRLSNKKMNLISEKITQDIAGTKNFRNLINSQKRDFMRKMNLRKINKSSSFALESKKSLK